MNLPPVFIDNVTRGFEGGAEWLTRLPELLEHAARRWQLSIGEPFLLSYNYACAATRADGTPVVLKIGVPNVELTSEINTLRLYAGEGACRLLEADEEVGMLLLERLMPGKMLVTLDDDDESTRIAADVLGRVQRPAPDAQGFLTLKGWFDGLKGLRMRYHGGTGPYPEKTVGRIEGILAELFSEDRPQVLLHGDFHHYNILLSERGWLCIDPKGVIGAPEYDLAPFLMNPIESLPDEKDAIRRTQRRIAILAECLGFDCQRIWRWAFCFSLLSSWWDLAPDGLGGEFSCPWMEIFSKIKI